MKTKGLQFVSICMALTVLLSSFSISVNKHICGDEVTDVSLFSHAEKCEMMAARSKQPSCHQPVKCCDNQTVLINSEFNNLTQQIKILDLLYEHKKAQTIIPKRTCHYSDTFRGE